MANFQNFRSAFHGFNRQDVVNYIEYMNQKHRSEVEQLNNQLRAAKEEIVALKAAVPHEDGISGDTELEAYRRAERAERKAQERAAQIYQQANAALADATAKVEAVSDGVAAMADQMAAKLENSKQELQAAVEAMQAICPEAE